MTESWSTDILVSCFTKTVEEPPRSSSTLDLNPVEIKEPCGTVDPSDNSFQLSPGSLSSTFPFTSVTVIKFAEYKGVIKTIIKKY